MAMQAAKNYGAYAAAKTQQALNRMQLPVQVVGQQPLPTTMQDVADYISKLMATLHDSGAHF